MGDKPLMIDLYAGLGGWAEGGLAEGYRVVGFDIEQHVYGDARYPAQLVLQDVLTIHGRQFKDAALFVASPPCQAYSYRAMPWKRAKALPPPDNSLFEACFRIQREACEAANRYIPLVVENVRGAQPYVGRAKWHFGSFYLWGDVPALMPITKRAKVGGFSWSDFGKPGYKPQGFNSEAEKRLRDDIKGNGGAWFKDADTADGTYGPGNFRRAIEGIKAGDRNKARANGGHRWDTGFDVAIKGEGGGWFNDNKRAGKSAATGRLSQSGSKSSARKAASAHIAKIPLVLSRHIARSWYPC